MGNKQRIYQFKARIEHAKFHNETQGDLFWAIGVPGHPLLRPPVFVLSSPLPPSMSEFEEAKVVADPEVEVSPSLTF